MRRQMQMGNPMAFDADTAFKQEKAALGAVRSLMKFLHTFIILILLKAEK